MKYPELVTITAFILALGSCSKRSEEAMIPAPPIIHVQPGKFCLHYKKNDIIDPNAIDLAIKECGPKTLDIRYTPNSTSADLDAALTHFGGLGIGDYNLTTTAGEIFPFFLPGIADAGALDRIVNSPHTTYPLDEVLSGHSLIPIPVFSHVLFPDHPVSLADFEECLRRCKSARCVFLDRIGQGALFTGRYEDWIRINETKNAEPPK